MKILYIHQYFKTPEEGGVVRSYYLAKGLVAHGYEVEMITAHNQKKYKKVVRDGITIHYLPVFYDNKLGFIKRVYAFLKFVRLARKKATEIKNVDICYAMSTPLTVGMIALWIKKRLGIPYYFEVGDLWPEAPIQMGAIKNRFLKKGLYDFEKKVYQEADKLIALSPSIRNSMEKTAPGKQTFIIPNMSDCSFFDMEIKHKELEEKFNVENKFVITYFGAVGKANHLEFLVNAAEKCLDLRVRFLVMGYGSELNRIKKLAAQKNIQNLTFLPYGNKENLREVLNITDAVYVSYADVPVLETGSPNKYFDALASGKLIIQNFGGWLKEITETNNCGFYTNPHKPNELIEKLQPILEDKKLLLHQQKNARSVAKSYFSKALQVQKLLKIFDNEYQMKVSDSQVYILTA